MIRKVVTSKIAQNKLEELFEHLTKEWSYKVKSDFVKKLDDSIGIIKEHPELFPESQKVPGLRKCVITRQTTLYYRFDSEKITVVTIFDTRQHPNRLRKDL